MSVPRSSVQSTPLTAWERFFYRGDRLLAEVTLLAAGLSLDHDHSDLVRGVTQIKRSFGLSTVHEPVSAFSAYQEAQAEPANSVEAWKQYLPVAELPDALLFWVLYRKLPALEDALQFGEYCYFGVFQYSFRDYFLAALIFFIR